MPIKVIIIGAGLAGLGLAHFLRRSGINFDVFERDDSPWARRQGYRLHLEADALNALSEVLPADLHALFTATAQYTQPYTTVLDQALRVVKRIETDANHDAVRWPDAKQTDAHCNVDRATLRQILLSRLESKCHFGKRLLRYEQQPAGIKVFFDDGSTAEGDVLVGADGVRSVVRQQRAPHAAIADTGICAIYGRIPFDRATEIVPAEVFDDIFAITSDERKVFLGIGSVRFPEPTEVAAARLAEDVHLTAQEDYVVGIVGGRREYFPVDLATLRVADGKALQSVAIELLRAWPEQSRALIERCDPDSVFLVEMVSSVPCTLDVPRNVTLLGDAIHAMTPTLGRGANLAMRDAALLGRAFGSVAKGEVTLGQALGAFETDMLAYGFRVVKESAAMGQQRMGQKPLP